MPEFENATTGDYSPENGKIAWVRISILNTTPAEMHNLCNLIKNWCLNPDSSDPTTINRAVKVSETVEYPIERIRREKKAMEREKKNKEKESPPELNADKPSMHKKILNMIVSFLTENGPSGKGAIKEGVIPGKTPKDKEYYAFHAAFSSLQRKEKITRTTPLAMDSDWAVKEDEV